MIYGHVLADAIRTCVPLIAVVTLAASCATPACAPAPTAAVAAAPALTNPTSQPKPPKLSFELITIGFRIAATDCAACHAIDRSSPSPDRAAMPFRQMLANYRSENPAIDLMTAVHGRHADMPAHQIDAFAAEALVAFMWAINAPAASK